MSQLSSFIFSSDRKKPACTHTTILLGAWVFIGLVVIDTFINVVFSYPGDPKVLNPSQLQSYFDYGRSQEGKLRRITRQDKTQTAPITLAGWYDPLEIREPATNSTDKIVTFYGMSHAVNLADALGRVSDRYVPRVVGAPGATANWAYGAYLRDYGGGTSSAVVLAIMSGNLAMINTMSAITWNASVAMPYTADRFLLDDGELKVVHPPYASFDQYVQTFYNDKKWSEALRVFAKYDSMYDSFIVRDSILDHSAFFRLLRRAYAERIIRETRHAVLDRTGYNHNSNEIKVARRIIKEFAIHARSNGMIPIIFVVNLFGDSDYLFQALRPELEQDKIPSLNSATIASPSDPRKYLPDSHFTPKVDDEMARALIKVIEDASRH
jgi:hypothetical protein